MTKIVDLCESFCDRGDRNFEVLLGGQEGNHRGETGLEEYKVSSRSHGCDNGGSRQRERTARFQRERFQGPAQRVVLNTVPTTRLDGEFSCYFLYGSFNDLRNILSLLLPQKRKINNCNKILKRIAAAFFLKS